MFRPSVRSLLSALALFAAASLPAQTLSPAIKATIGDREADIGAPVALTLSDYFEIDGLTGSVVRLNTVLGTFDVELFDTVTPNHAANFLNYARNGRYNNTFIHRAAKFEANANRAAIVQGGGYAYPNVTTHIPVFGTVPLEYNLPNARGTLAAARGDSVNSATSEWYFNVIDNSETLGPSNPGGGYTVFGRVLSTGMEVVDAIAQLPTVNLSSTLSAFATVPVRDYTTDATVEEKHLIFINRAFVVPKYPSSSTGNGALVFSAESSAPGVVTAAVELSTLTLTPVSSGTATITVTATDIRGVAVSQHFTFASASAVFTTQPASVNVAPGGSATFTSAVSGGGTVTYQWYRHQSGEASPQALAGATAATLTLNNVQAADMGFYFVRATEGATTIQSQAAILTTTGGTSRLSNLSTRGRIAAGGTLTPGFVLSGTGTKNLLVRGVGPRLAELGLPNDALTDPTMALIPLGAGAESAVATNDNWGTATNAANVVTTSAAVGAFPLGAGSLDAALLTGVALPNSQGNSGYTVRINSTSATATGVTLAEVYDPDAAGVGPRLINVSALGSSGSGLDALVPGFVVDGTGAKSMLIRVAGPSIGAAPFNVPGTMVDPRLSIIPAGQSFAIGANDNWGGTPALKAAFAASGAFAFASDGSLDAAILVRLPPGGYTVVVEGAAGGSGVILVEAYDLD